MRAGLVTFRIPITPEGKAMGEVRVKARLTNAGDAHKARHGEITLEQVRSKEVEAIVDTGAMLTVIPPELAQELGLAVVGESVARYANGTSETVGTTEPILVELEGRSASDDALIIGDEVQIGQTVLEKTDLLVDCSNRRLIANPKHPDGPVLYIR